MAFATGILWGTHVLCAYSIKLYDVDGFTVSVAQDEYRTFCCYQVLCAFDIKLQ